MNIETIAIASQIALALTFLCLVILLWQRDGGTVWRLFRLLATLDLVRAIIGAFITATRPALIYQIGYSAHVGVVTAIVTLVVATFLVTVLWQERKKIKP